MRISDWSSDVCSSDLTMAAHADLIDQLLRDLLDFAMHHVFPAPNPTTGDRICVAAVGGYGRGELAPWSDVDLLFLLPYKKTPRSEQVVEYVLYMLWDTRSEEHTSELQSLMRISYAVFCLKKKTN